MKGCYFMFLLIVFFSCKKAVVKKASIYDKPKEYLFESSYSDGRGKHHLETLRFKVTGGVIESNGQYETIWIYDTNSKYIVGGKWAIQEVTGAVDVSNMIWIHPPRDNQYDFLQQTAFPLVQFPLQLGKEWAWTITEKKGYTTHYKIKEEKKILVGMDELDVWVIKSISEKEPYKIGAEYLFNLDLGFVGMNYEDTEGRKLTLNLVEYSVSNK